MAKIRKPTAKVVLMKNKTLRDGKFPIALRITYLRRSKYFVLKTNDGQTVTSAIGTWNVEFGRFGRNKEMNILLSAYEEKARTAINIICDNGGFTFNKFGQQYFSIPEQTMVFKYLLTIIHELQNDQRLSTAKTFKDTLNRLKEFKKHEFTFHDIDIKFLLNFEKYLQGKGNNANTIGIYIRSLRTAYNKAINSGLVPAEMYPFKKFKIKVAATKKRALTKQQIMDIINYKEV